MTILRGLLKTFGKGKWIFAATLVVALLVVAIPHPAQACVFLCIEDVLQTAVASFAFGVTWLISLIAGVVIALQAWFLQIVLSISFGLVNAAPVRIGFPIVLALANLFFVGGLVAIAIATITRQEDYSMKKVLWKLVVMAILVNFGLVICGSLLSLSDSLTKYFIESISPGTTGPDGTSDFFGFAGRMAGAFNPELNFIGVDDVTNNPALSKEALSWGAEAGNSIGEILKPLVSILATLAAFVIIIITLGTLIGMLLWRYIRVGMALIILPIAWASWIFPAYQEHYKKWWTKFTQWTIFPPVVVFFLWLGLKISEVMNQQDGEFAPLYQNQSQNSAMRFIAEFFGNLFTPIIAQTLKAMILWGIMMGGMVAAQELGVKFADAGYKAIENAGGWAKTKAMNYSKRAAGATGHAIDRLPGRALNKLGVEGADGKGVSDWLAGNKRFSTVAGAGRALKGLYAKTGHDLVEESKKHSHTKNDDERVEQLETAMELPDQLAELDKMDNLGKVKKVGNMNFVDWLAKNHQKIGDYQMHGLEKKLKDLGISHGLLEAVKKGSGIEEAVMKSAKDADPRDMVNLLRNNALGLDSSKPDQKKKLDALHNGVIKSIKGAFSAGQFASLVEEASGSRTQMNNLQTAMDRVIGGSPARAEESLGSDVMDAIRTNGPIQDLGVTSEVWGEARRDPSAVNQRPISGRRKPKKKDKDDKKPPAAPPAHAPAAPSGGGGGSSAGGGGGGKSGGGGGHTH